MQAMALQSLTDLMDVIQILARFMLSSVFLPRSALRGVGGAPSGY